MTAGGRAFRPVSQEDLAPSGAKARFDANLDAITVARRLTVEGRAATEDEQRRLARWSSWGAIPQVFDETNTDWTHERGLLRDTLDEAEWRAAARTTINAHYTDPAYVTQIWAALSRLGFTAGDVLEPAFMRKSGVSRDIRCLTA